MIGYHPAFDPLHSAFRMVQLLSAAPDGEMENDRLRISDFYLLFPHLVASMRLPRDHVSWRSRFKPLENPYWFSGDPLLVFRRIAPIQEAGLALLQTVGVAESIGLGPQDLLWHLRGVPKELSRLVRDRSDQDGLFFEFLGKVLLTLPLRGQDGLKHRTGLLDFRYDAT